MLGNLFMVALHFIVGLLKWVLIIGSAVASPFVISGLIHLIYYRHKGLRFKQRKYTPTVRRRNIFVRLFKDFPKRVVLDMLHKDPDSFPHSGIVMIVGEQGAGKTTCAAHLLRCMKDKYPHVKILSNTPLSFADGEITSPDDIIFCNNGTLGCIKFLDEIHSWFNSSESQYFPPEMLSEVSQQRKQFSLIIGTAQRFDRISKAIRQQTGYIIKPITLAGCLTICRVYKPRITDTGEIIKLRGIKTYFFVHDDELRDCFDTFAKIKRLSMKGFKPRSEQYTSDNDPSPIIVTDNQKKNRK